MKRVQIGRSIKYFLIGGYLILAISSIGNKTVYPDVFPAEGTTVLQGEWLGPEYSRADGGMEEKYTIIMPDQKYSLPGLLVASTYQQVKIYLDGEIIYHFDGGKEGWKATRMMYLPVILPADYVGKQLVIKGVQSASIFLGKEPSVLLGERHELVYKIIRKELLNSINGALLLILGLIFTTDTYVLAKHYKIHVKETASMSLASLFAGGWLITESRMISQFFCHYVTAYYINYCCFYLMVIKLMDFLSGIENGGNDRRIKKIGMLYRLLFSIGVLGEFTYTFNFFTLQAVMLPSIIIGFGTAFFLLLKGRGSVEGKVKICMSFLFCATGILDAGWMYKKIYLLKDGVLFTQISALTIIIYIITRVAFFFLKAIQEDVLNQTLKLHLDTQVRHYDSILQEQREAAIYRHDNKNRYMTLFVLMEQNKLEDAKKYLKQMLEEVRMENSREIWGSPVLDAIIQQKRNEALENGVEFQTDLDIPKGIDIEPDDWVAVVGNLLDNAMEACVKVRRSERYIYVCIKYQRGVLVIEVRNGVNEPEIDFTRSSKAKRSGHGYGLLSIRQAIKKYDGELNIAVHEYVCSAIAILKCST